MIVQNLRPETLERVLTGDSDFKDEEEAEQLQFLNTSPWKRKVDMPFESRELVELQNVNYLLKKLPKSNSNYRRIT